MSVNYEKMLSEKGRILLVVDGFKFRRHKPLANNLHRWICTRSACKAFLKINLENIIVDANSCHNHERDDEKKLQIDSFRNLLKRKAIENPSVLPSKLLAHELRKENAPQLSPDDVIKIRKNISYTQVHHTRLPKPMSEFCEVLTDVNFITNEEFETGNLIVEGKTKRIFELVNDPSLCLLINKDKIITGDDVNLHSIVGKSAISNATAVKVFTLLNEVGIKTSFIKVADDTSFVAKKCGMVPIEWVIRRLATGSFLKKHTGVAEGYRFNPPLQETFFKDNFNNYPQWSEQQIISAEFKLNGITIGKDEIDIMQRTTLAVFEVLERAWATRDCTLVDLKIEFGIDTDGDILVADIIDNDSWRLWPSDDKRLMKNKQIHRNLTRVTNADLNTIERNYEWVADQLEYLVPPPSSKVVIFMGSPSDKDHCDKIAKHANELGLNVQLRVCSAHKASAETLRILSEYEGTDEKVVLIAVAGRSNGLGPVLSGNTALPVINCPSVTSHNIRKDVWSSLNVSSGLGCTTVLYPESAALAAAQIHAIHDHIVWSRLRVMQLNNFINLKYADANIRNNLY